MEISLFKPHEAQLRVIEGFADSNHKFGIFVAPRQIGKSLLGQNLLLYWALSKPKQKCCWASPIFAQAKKVFQELINASHEVIKHSNKAELTIEFINGSTIIFLSTDRPDSIRGYSFNYVIIDECAYVKEESITQAILPTLTAVGKKCLMISTPRGKNHFYEWYLKGIQKNDTYISFRAMSYENPYADLEFIEQQKQSLPISIYKSEYEGEFTDASSDVFRGIDNVTTVGNYEQSNKREKCFAAVDVGLARDYSVLSIINDSGRVCFMDRRNGENITSIAEKFMAHLSRFNIVGGYVEVNGVGRGLYDIISPKFRKIKPFTTNQDNKTKMVRALIDDIENLNISIPTKELNPHLYNELNAYTYKLSPNGKISFSHPNGFHDDCVDALMMSNYARHNMATSGIHIGNQKQQLEQTIIPGQQQYNTNQSIRTKWAR